jgi:hypothetical protein
MRFLKEYYMAIYGLAVVVLAIGMPTGIMGLIEKHIPRVFVWLEPHAEIPAAVLRRETERP